MPDENKIRLEVIGETWFTLSHEGLNIIFWWQRETEVRNFIWVRCLRIGLKWPPVSYVESFMEIDPDREGI